MNICSAWLHVLVLLILIVGAHAKDVGLQYKANDHEAYESQYGAYPYRTHRTTDLEVPVIHRLQDQPECHDDNYVFLSPRGFKVSDPAVTIYDNEGRLVWAQHVKGEPYNLEVQEWKGEKVLTFWTGDDTVGGHGEGTWHVYNSSYHEIATISGGNGFKADLHELIITPEGTAIVTVYLATPVQAPGYFKFTDTVWIYECIFQEVNINTHEVLFEWRALEHHTLEDSYRTIEGLGEGLSQEHPWDWFHINSVQKDKLGNYLVSARYTNTITYIDGKTGDIIWVLGGKRNSFEDLGGDSATNMAYQHNARLWDMSVFPDLLADEIENEKNETNDGRIKQMLTAFDNADHEMSAMSPSRGVLIALTYPADPGSPQSLYIPFTAQLIRSYDHPLRFTAPSQGNIQVLPSQAGGDPKMVIGYGNAALWTEFTASGRMLCDSRFAAATSWGTNDVQSYRVVKAKWAGYPTTSPAVVFGSSSLIVSWNGATEVRHWRLQRLRTNGDSEKLKDWINVATFEKRRFETELKYDRAKLAGARYLRLVALDKGSGVLGTSEVLDLSWKSVVPTDYTTAKKRPISAFLVVCLCLAGLTIMYRSLGSCRLLLYSGYQALRQRAQH